MHMDPKELRKLLGAKKFAMVRAEVLRLQKAGKGPDEICDQLNKKFPMPDWVPLFIVVI
jgi:hypothetical protein